MRGPTLLLAGLLAIGCLGPETPTYSGDVAGILDRNCVPCHRPGQVAPFPLTSYEEVAPRAALVAAITAEGTMPPWKPVEGWGRFRGERRLTPEEIATLASWVEAGAPEGDPRRRPARPTFAEGWQLGEPDLEATTREAYVVPSQGEDVFRNFVVPVETARGHWVRAIELRFSQPRVVHHATVLVDRSRVGRRLEEDDGQPGFDAMVWGAEIVPPEGHLIGWTPGIEPQPLPDGTWWRLPEGADLIVETHLLPSGREEQLEVSVGLHWAAEEPSVRPAIVWLGSEALDIPAGTRDYEVEDSFTLPVAVDVLSLYPHAHYLGRTVRLLARRPDGTEHRLLRIDDWDINWQSDYDLVEPLRLEAGTELHLGMTFDNSSDNWANPHDPPQRVTFGPSAREEMANVWVQVAAVDPDDRPALARALASSRFTMRLDGLQARVDRSPDDPDARLAIGDFLARSGAPNQALPHLRRAARERPDDVVVATNLAVALARTGRTEEALAHLAEALGTDAGSPTERAGARTQRAAILRATGRSGEAASELERAVRLDPEAGEALAALAGLRLEAGRIDEARDLARRALVSRPSNPEARFVAATAAAVAGDADGAEVHYRAVLDHEPDHVGTMFNLAMLRASRGAVEEAIALLERALELRPGDPAATRELRELRARATGA